MTGKPLKQEIVSSNRGEQDKRGIFQNTVIKACVAKEYFSPLVIFKCEEIRVNSWSLFCVIYSLYTVCYLFS